MAEHSVCDPILGVSTPEQIAAQAETLARVRALRVKRDDAATTVAALDEQLRQAIMNALKQGAAPKDVAVAADLSRQRISQIARGQ
jgi:hypothetical protein